MREGEVTKSAGIINIIIKALFNIMKKICEHSCFLTVIRKSVK